MTQEAFYDQLKNKLNYSDSEIMKVKSLSSIDRAISELFDSEQVLYVWRSSITGDSVLRNIMLDFTLVITNKRIMFYQKGLLGTITNEYSIRKAHSITIENNCRLIIYPSANEAPVKLNLFNENRVGQLKELIYDYI